MHIALYPRTYRDGAFKCPWSAGVLRGESKFLQE